MTAHIDIAVLVPCHNEAASIRQVIEAFRDSLPEAVIYVYDNNSTDGTAAIAREEGAIVRHERRKGKGNVVRRMFSDIEADVYILVDGDDTYDASVASEMVRRLVESNYDVVNCARLPVADDAFRRGHKFGNWMLTFLVSSVFGRQNSDMLSGYKALSRRMVKSFPIKSQGFEIETELLVHCLEMGLPIDEISAPYRERQEGSQSKLSTYRDGLRILWLISHLIREERPLQFFSLVALILIGVSLGIGVPIFVEFERTGLVPRLPSALLATGLMLSGFLSITIGLVLDGVARGRREAKLLSYLSYRSDR